ncbi:tricorn protease [Paucibacter oligotrophus]|uniref:Tricorn protease homolog n=1 Tax=Roseateles oligotrophus TaxID=1769250 RepID=A0A840L6U4_9BURK|nr:S41 family peptidase [Roseateles oligotrophus]MBB4844294.1 tricorn protease [Roseateles oligotrophus]
MSKYKKLLGLATGLGLATVGAWAQPAAGSQLLRQPSVSAQHLAFVYGGDIWVSDRNGQNARQLTQHAAAEFAPAISPDGRWIAFSAAYEGNTDVYLMPINGGQARRLTWHPAADVVNGWSPDGKKILFASNREVANNRSNQLYEVSAEAGAASVFEQKVMEAVAYEGAWSPDGKRLAYRPYKQAYNGPSGWRQHRGGTTPPIWIIDPATQKLEAVPHVNASDINPLWVGQELVFISDRADGAANLFAYNSATQALRQLTPQTQWDVRSAAAHGSQIVYESAGLLHELDLASGQSRRLNIQLSPNAPQARTQWKEVSRQIDSAQLSATGKRVIVGARGDVFMLPVKDGSLRNLTESSGVREKDALGSPDGLRVAYISDEAERKQNPADGAGRQHHIVLRDQAGLEKPKRFALGKSGYFTLLAWSPDGQRLIYQDNHLNLYSLSLSPAVGASGFGTAQRIASSPRRGPFDVAFSPDSRWLAYTLRGENHFSQIRLHEFASGKEVAVGDGLAHAGNPVFSSNGEALYFTASTNSGITQVGLDMSTRERPQRLGIYAAVLAADGKSPLLPKNGDEGEPKKAQDKKDEVKPPIKPTRVDASGLNERIVGLPVPERNYAALSVAADGALFYLDRRQAGASLDAPDKRGQEGAELYRFDFEEREAKSLRQGLEGYEISPDGKKLLLRGAKASLEIADAGPKLDAKPVDTAALRMRVNPREEWRQIFDETWWMQKEYFYDPKLHGLDWDAVYARYLPLLDHVQTREDLNELLVEMIAELQVGHNRVSGGDVHQEAKVAVGLLGADFRVEGGYYRIAKIYGGDRWSPFMKAPLAAPGLGVKVGDYLMAINGRPLDARQNLFALLENTVGKQLSLSIASDPAAKAPRQAVVVPVANEAGLRRWDWIEGNRQYVERQSGGRLAYVYLPDTADEGFTFFNRMFFAQIGRDGLIVDDRRNGGGQAANYVLDVLSRPYLSSWKDRDGLIYDTPGGAIYGPKAMLIDQDAGSGGDFLPYGFKRLGLGPLIGKRTWGGLIGISANPSLIDGGQLVVPFFRFFTPEGEWRVENEGVAPDIEVELDPLQVNQGRDSQLDAAIANVLERLKTYKPVQRKTAPAMPTELGK